MLTCCYHTNAGGFLRRTSSFLWPNLINILLTEISYIFISFQAIIEQGVLDSLIVAFMETTAPVSVQAEVTAALAVLASNGKCYLKPCCRDVLVRYHILLILLCAVT